MTPIGSDKLINYDRTTWSKTSREVSVPRGAACCLVVNIFLKNPGLCVVAPQGFATVPVSTVQYSLT